MLYTEFVIGRNWIDGNKIVERKARFAVRGNGEIQIAEEYIPLYLISR